MPGGQPLWAGNFPFVPCTFLFCFAPRKPFALFCRARKYQKTLEAPQAALLRLVLPGSKRYWRLPLMSGIALFQVLCRFPDLSVTTALRLEFRLPWLLHFIHSWQETAKARSLPSTAGNGPGVLVFCQTLSFKEKGRLWPLGSCPLPGGSCRAVPQKATLELALLLREKTV